LFAYVCGLCSLTAETEKLIDADALGRMKPSAYLLNAARGRVVDEPALVDVLARRQIRGAALDVTVEEPLPAASPLWATEHVLITYRGRDLPLRGQCACDHGGESGAARPSCSTRWFRPSSLRATLSFILEGG
jgi:D-isomer specific 2-hydroxyacid dehydrogenase-like protein